MASLQDVLHPKGKLDRAVLWPGRRRNEVESDIQAWLSEGTNKTTVMTVTVNRDEAVKHWVYYRAYDSVYQRLVTMPSSVAANDEGSSSHAVEQIKLMKDLRDQELADFDELLAVVTASAVLVPPRSSYSAPTQFRF